MAHTACLGPHPAPTLRWEGATPGSGCHGAPRALQLQVHTHLWLLQLQGHSWPGLGRAFLHQPLGGQEDGVCCGAGTRQPYKQWARWGPREAPKVGQVTNLRGLVCPSSMGVQQTLRAPQRGLDMAGVGVGWQLPSRGSTARAGAPPGGWDTAGRSAASGTPGKETTALHSATVATITQQVGS